VPLQRPTRFEHSERVGPRSECRLPEAGEAVGAVAKQTDASDAKAEEAEDVDDDEILAERGSTLDFRIAGITWVCNGCGGCLLFLGADLRGENRLEDAIDEGTHPFLKAQRVHSKLEIAERREASDGCVEHREAGHLLRPDRQLQHGHKILGVSAIEE
jgi:hypothetical protein